MKLLTLGLLILLLTSTSAVAAMLACDPPEASLNVTGSQVEFDGSWDTVVPFGNCTDKAPGCVWKDSNGVDNYILMDLDGIVDGQHTVRARFINIWGEGQISDPFDFAKQRPGKKSIRLIP